MNIISPGDSVRPLNARPPRLRSAVEGGRSAGGEPEGPKAKRLLHSPAGQLQPLLVLGGHRTTVYELTVETKPD